MPRNKKKCVRPKCIKATNTTIGILSALGVTAGTVVATLMGREMAVKGCHDASSTLGSTISSFLNRTFSSKGYSFNITTDFPSQIPIITNLTTPYGDIPINTTVPLNLPNSIIVTPPAVVESYADIMKEIFGEGFVDFLNLFPQNINDTCSEYSPYAVYIFGTAYGLYMIWQITTTFAFGSQLCVHEVRIEDLEDDELNQMEMGTRRR